MFFSLWAPSAASSLFEDVADFDAAVCDDADATDDTDEDIT